MGHYEKLYKRDTKQYVYWIERDQIGIALFDSSRNDTNRFGSLTEALQITLFYHKKALHFGVNIVNNAEVSTLTSTALMTEESELPLQFHQYLIDRAVQLGYEEKPEMIQMAPYFEKKFEKGIKEGKSFANRGRISGSRSVVQRDM